MKTEFLEKLIPETVEGRDEIIKKIFAENGKDVNAEKAKHADYETAKADLTTAQETIKALEKAKGDTAALQAEIDKYKVADEKRVADEKAAAARREVEERFNAVAGERKFVHDFVRKGVVGEFEAALADPANKGKGDKEIFDALTKDKDYFASANPPAEKMGGMGGSGGTVDGVEAAFLARNPGMKI
jgi:hypothetical protein